MAKQSKSRYNPVKYSKRISETNNLIFKPNDGLYEYVRDKGFWQPIHENYIEGQAFEMINGDATTARITDVRKLVERGNLMPNGRDFDDQTELINLRNGMFSIRTRKLVPHNKDFFSTIQLNVTYDPKATCCRWEQFLLEVLDYDLELFDLMQEFIGYSLIPDTRFEKALLMLGEGANGKSTLIKVWEQLVGQENIASVTLSGLGNEFHRVTLHGKLLNITAEINPMTVQQSDYFKRVVSGDTIDASHKFKPVFHFQPYARLVFAMNRLPRVKDTSHGYYRRLLIVPFDRIFDGDNADRELSNKLLSELDGIFMWALQGLERLYTKEAFSESSRVTEMLKQYTRMNNPLIAFVEDCCMLDVSASISKDTIYDSYKTYANKYGYSAVSATTFFRELYAAYPSVRASRLGSRDHREQWVKGIDLIPFLSI
jgi:putative DNA primase/helicase